MKLNELLSPELYAQVQTEIDKANAGQADKTKHVRFADLSEGGYVSVDRHNSKVGALTQQVEDLQNQIKQRDTDLAGMQDRLKAAQTDASKLSEAQTALAALQSQYDTAQKEWDGKIQKQKYEFMVQEKAGSLKFSSAAAKRDFIRQANGMEFKVDGEALLGYDDFVAKYKTENPGAVVDPEPAPAPGSNPPPTVVLPAGGSPAPKGKSLAEMMKAKNANPNMEVNFDN